MIYKFKAYIPVIHASAFIHPLASVTGNVTIEFKDIYSKSDMLLSNVPSMTYYGAPLKSAGEFFIKVLEGTNALLLDVGKSLTVEQPNPSGIIDMGISSFIGHKDTVNSSILWAPSPFDSTFSNTTNYIYSLYTLSTPADSGT